MAALLDERGGEVGTLGFATSRKDAGDALSGRA
jgi:hypothetical protein